MHDGQESNSNGCNVEVVEKTVATLPSIGLQKQAVKLSEPSVKPQDSQRDTMNQLLTYR